MALVQFKETSDERQRAGKLRRNAILTHLGSVTDFQKPSRKTRAEPDVLAWQVMYGSHRDCRMAARMRASPIILGRIDVAAGSKQVVGGEANEYRHRAR